VKDVEVRERLNELIDELNLYLSDKSVEPYLERLKFAQDELEEESSENTRENATANKSASKKHGTGQSDRSKPHKNRGSWEMKAFCTVCKEIVDADAVYISGIDLIEILLSCGHKRFLKFQEPSERPGAIYLVDWDLPAKSYALRKAFYRALNRLCRDAGDYDHSTRSVFRTSDRELAFKVYALASEYGRANLYEARLLKTSESK